MPAHELVLLLVALLQFPPAVEVCVASGPETAGVLARVDVARCHDRAWHWAEVEPAITSALTLLDAEAKAPAEARALTIPPRAGVDVPMPKRTRDAQAVYPEDALAHGVSGFVIVDLVIDPKGNVRGATVAKSVPRLDDAAVRAARKWKFAPTLVAGTPITVHAYAAVRFGRTLEPIPSDWLEFATFYYERGLHTLARAALQTALIKTREDRARFDGYIDGRRKSAIDGVTMPVQTKTVRPQYPFRAVQTRTSGEVLVEAIIDTRGRVGRARIVSDPSLLDAAAVNAVLEWQFTPAMKAGVPVAMSVVAIVEFRLR